MQNSPMAHAACLEFIGVQVAKLASTKEETVGLIMDEEHPLQIWLYTLKFYKEAEKKISWKKKHSFHWKMYEGHLESKERFAIQRYLLIIGKKKNMQVLWHTFTYFST